MPRKKRVSLLCSIAKNMYPKFKWIVQYYSDKETSIKIKQFIERNKESEFIEEIRKIYTALPKDKFNSISSPPGFKELEWIWEQITDQETNG